MWRCLTKLKDKKKVAPEVQAVPKISRRAEAALPFEERVKIVSDRNAPKEDSADEEVEAF